MSGWLRWPPPRSGNEATARVPAERSSWIWYQKWKLRGEPGLILIPDGGVADVVAAGLILARTRIAHVSQMPLPQSTSTRASSVSHVGNPVPRSVQVKVPDTTAPEKIRPSNAVVVELLVHGEPSGATVAVSFLRVSW